MTSLIHKALFTEDMVAWVDDSWVHSQTPAQVAVEELLKDCIDPGWGCDDVDGPIFKPGERIFLLV